MRDETPCPELPTPERRLWERWLWAWRALFYGLLTWIAWCLRMPDVVSTVDRRLAESLTPQSP